MVHRCRDRMFSATRTHRGLKDPNKVRTLAVGRQSSSSDSQEVAVRAGEPGGAKQSLLFGRVAVQLGLLVPSDVSPATPKPQSATCWASWTGLIPSGLPEQACRDPGLWRIGTTPPELPSSVERGDVIDSRVARWEFTANHVWCCTGCALVCGVGVRLELAACIHFLVGPAL